MQDNNTSGFGGGLLGAMNNASETPEEKAERITNTAESHNIDPETLLDAEELLEDAARTKLAEHENILDELINQNPQVAPLLSMFGSEEMVMKIARALLKNPELGAETVVLVHTILQETGLYNELETESPDLTL